MRRLLIVLLLASLVAAACSREEPARQAEGKHWTVQGKIVSLSPDDKRVEIDHQDIPGLMAAMTMTFPVVDARLLSGVKPGDGVEFELAQTDAGIVVTALRKLDAAQLKEGKAAILSGRGKVVVVNRKAAGVLLKHDGLSDGSPGGELMLGVKPPSLLEGIQDGDSVEFAVDFTGEYPVITALKKRGK